MTNLKLKYYWLLPIALFVVQAIFTFNSFSQIRYEELAESIRNPFWLQQRTLYDGVSSNVGWYGILMLLYNLFGFSLYIAKYFRLILHLLSMIFLMLFLDSFLKRKNTLVPLITIGLSPSLLYLNTLQTGIGTDLQYLPICLYFLTFINFKKQLQAIIKTCIGFLVAMIAWMSYPAFIFYLPILGFIYFWQLYKLGIFKKLSNFIIYSSISILSFLTPLLIAFIYVKDKNLLLFDQVSKGGIFRGGAVLSFDASLLTENILVTLTDLFSKAISYHFDLFKVEFSDVYPILAVILILLGSIYLFFKQRPAKAIIVLGWYLMIAGLLLVNFNTIPGIRRSTTILASFYAFFTVCWNYVLLEKYHQRFVKYLLLGILLLIPLHHILVYPINIIHLKDPSPYAQEQWFKIAETPQKALEIMMNIVQKQDLNLSCQNNRGQQIFCRLPEVYAAVAGSCYWNKLSCRKIQAIDPKSGQLIELSTKLWEQYYFEH